MGFGGFDFGGYPSGWDPTLVWDTKFPGSDFGVVGGGGIGSPWPGKGGGGTDWGGIDLGGLGGSLGGILAGIFGGGSGGGGGDTQTSPTATTRTGMDPALAAILVDQEKQKRQSSGSYDPAKPSLPGSGSRTPSGSTKGLLDLLKPILTATSAAALASLIRKQAGIDPKQLAAIQAQRSADYQKNFVKIPIMQRTAQQLPTGYNPAAGGDPQRFSVQLGGYAVPGSPTPMIPPAGIGGGYAHGGAMPMGIMGLPRPVHEGMVNGSGSGMDDHVHARSGDQEIRLSDGEFVLPADIVSAIGDGSTSAGAKRLHAMMNNIRQSKYGRQQQPPKMRGGLLPG